jgi:hypothetical protein
MIFKKEKEYIDGWEFDKRRLNLVLGMLNPGESLTWYEADPVFAEHEYVLKTLRRLPEGITFLAQSPDGKNVLTVGSIDFDRPVKRKCSWPSRLKK